MFFLDNIGCEDLAPLINIVRIVIRLIQYAVPIAIILLGSIDLFKAVIASKDDEIKAAQKMLIKRIIYGVVIFFLATIVVLVFSAISGTTDEVNFVNCWSQKIKK